MKYDVELFTVKLKKYRKQLGLTQASLAEKIDVDVSYYSVIETGAKPPSMRILRKLSHVLEIPVACMLSDIEPMRITAPHVHERLSKLTKKDLKRLAIVLEALAYTEE